MKGSVAIERTVSTLLCAAQSPSWTPGSPRLRVPQGYLKGKVLLWECRAFAHGKRGPCFQLALWAVCAIRLCHRFSRGGLGHLTCPLRVRRCGVDRGGVRWCPVGGVPRGARVVPPVPAAEGTRLRRSSGGRSAACAVNDVVTERCTGAAVRQLQAPHHGARGDQAGHSRGGGT